jgi:hypothetical protein
MGPEMATSEASAIWAKKSQDFQGPPLPLGRVMDKTCTLIVLISTAPAAPHTFCCSDSCKNLAVRTKIYTLITFK